MNKYLVIDNEYNRIHYKEFIGRILDEPIPYAQIRIINPGDCCMEGVKTYDVRRKER